MKGGMALVATLTHVSRKQARDECRCKRVLFTSCNGDLTFFNAGRKVMILIPKVFLRLLQSFEPIFRRERQLHLSGSHKRISRQVLVCLPFIGGNFSCLLPTTKRFTFSFQKCRMSREFCRPFTGSWPEYH